MPDNYAQSNLTEDFAQQTVVKMYRYLHDGKLPDGFEIPCMQKQVNFVDNHPMFKKEDMLGDTCALSIPAR